MAPAALQRGQWHQGACSGAPMPVPWFDHEVHDHEIIGMSYVTLDKYLCPSEPSWAQASFAEQVSFLSVSLPSACSL